MVLNTTAVSASKAAEIVGIIVLAVLTYEYSQTLAYFRSSLNTGTLRRLTIRTYPIKCDVSLRP